MKYRPEIDGLRAIAVLLVIFFHAGFKGIPSGFIGVDIFFVISGYLVSSIIAQALALQRFSFASFFARRLWRLQPAMLSMLVVCTVIAAMVYLPDDLVAFLKSAKYTALFASNQYFERTTTGYAAPDSADQLLLHTWSLSIEWQWYLVLPAALWLLHRYCPVRFHKFVLAALMVAAFALAWTLSRHYPEKNYYFFSARIFEFLTGVIAASSAARARFMPLWARGGLSFLSIVALGWVALQAGLLLGFPDYHALIVCLAVGWLLTATAAQNDPCIKMLSWRPLVWVGTISYSLYLWHWPVFVTGHYLGLDGTAAYSILGLILTFVLGWVSYVGVEKRFRHRRHGLASSLLWLWLIPLLLLTGAYALVNKHGGYPARFGASLTSVLETLKHSEAPKRESCLGGRSGPVDPDCTIGAVDSASRSLLIGDSFSNQYWGFMDVLGKSANTSFLVRGTSSCLALPGVYLFNWWTFKNTVYSACHDNAEHYYDLIRTQHYRYVVMGQLWGNYEGDNVVVRPDDARSVPLSRSRVETAFEAALDIIIASGAQPVVIKATAPMPEQFNACFYQHFKLRGAWSGAECRLAGPVQSSGWFDGVFERFKRRYPQLIVIDPKDVQCDAKGCMSTIDGVPVYRDVGHITDFASYTFGKWYLERFSNPLK